MVILAILNIFAPPPDVCPSPDVTCRGWRQHWHWHSLDLRTDFDFGSGLGFRVLGFRVGLSLSGLSFWDVQQLWPDAGICATHVFCSCSIKTGRYQQEPAGQEMISIPTTKCRQKGGSNSHLKFPTIMVVRWYPPRLDGENTCQKKTTSSGFGNINNSSCITGDIGNFYGLGLRIPFCTLGRDWTSKHKGTAYIGYRNPQVDRKEIRLSW